MARSRCSSTASKQLSNRRNGHITLISTTTMLAAVILLLFSSIRSEEYNKVLENGGESSNSTSYIDFTLTQQSRDFNVAKRTPALAEFGNTLAPPEGYDGSVPWTTPEVSASNEDYGRATERGDKLRTYMRYPSKAGLLARSPWTEVEQLKEWGWEEASMAKWMESSPGIEELVEPVNHRVDKQYDISHKHDHPDETVISPGGRNTVYSYPATNAFYFNALYPDKGVIVADNNWSPTGFIAGYMTPKHMSWNKAKDKPPKLHQWSDVIWLGWKKYTTQEQRVSLRTIVRHNVNNEETREILARALRANWGGEVWADHGNAPPWPQTKVFTRQSTGWRALLGAPNISGVAWLCVQRSKELGVRLEIAKITVFHVHQIGIMPTMIVHLAPVPEHEGEPLSESEPSSEEETSADEESVVGSQPPSEAGSSHENDPSATTQELTQQGGQSSGGQPSGGNGKGKGKGKWSQRMKNPFMKMKKGKQKSGGGDGERPVIE